MMSAYPFIRITVGLPAALIALMTMTPAQAQTSSATYTVTFQGNWTLDSTPGGVVSSAHFTRLVGAVHNDMVTFWESGGTATAGVKDVAELGSVGKFKSEVAAAGANASLVEQGIGGTGTSKATFDIEVTSDHPLFTLLSMIGPSPDWFVGVSGLSLLDDQGQWRSEREVNLFPYDAGTRDGAEFRLGGSLTSPQGTITSIRGTGKFSDEPMAMLSFELQNPPQATAPGQVTGVSVTEQVEQLRVSWNAVAEANGYKVQWKSGAQNYSGGGRQRLVSSGTTTQYTITNLAAGVAYTVRVIATKDNAPDGSASAEVTGTPMSASTVAGAPQNLEAVAGNSEASLTWDAPNDDGGANITGYAYRYKESGGDFGDYVDIPDSGPGEANARSYTVTGLMNEREYVFHVRAVNEHGGGAPAEVAVMLPAVVHTESQELPTEVTLSGNYPNPFNPETTIRYGLPKAGDVRLAVYNLLGQEVAILVDQSKSAGHHTVRFGAGDLPSGVYVYRLQAGDKTMVRTMLLVK